MAQLEHDQTSLVGDMPVMLEEAQVESELRDLVAYSALDAAPLRVPVEVLGDREFELLMFRLFQDWQREQGKHPCGIEIRHDRTWLMQGTADMGRDVVLMRAGVAVGVVQCKHYASDYTLPQTLREICRFILAAKVYPALLPNPDDFTYVLALSRRANGKAASLFQEPARVLRESPELLTDAVDKAISDFKGLSELDPAKALAHVSDVLARIDIQLLQQQDLAIWLHSCEVVFSTFFQARYVVDKTEVLERLEKVIQLLNGNFSLEALDQSRELSALAVAQARKHDGTQRLISLSEVYIRRNIEDEIDNKIEKSCTTTDHGVLIAVVAPAGFGKTSLLWGCHQRWHERTDTVSLPLAAAQLATMLPGSGFETIRRALLQHAVNLRDAGIRFTVWLDTFDVLMHREDLWPLALQLIRELVELGASVIISSRPEELANLKLEDLVTSTVRLYLSEYDEDEFPRALQAHCAAFHAGADAMVQASLYATRLAELVALGRPAKDVCLNPLALRMLFELYAPDQVPEDIDSLRLYQQYLSTRVKVDVRAGTLYSTSKREGLLNTAKLIASKMFESSAPFLTEQQCDDLSLYSNVDEYDIRELISRHLLRRNAGRIEFFHQTFFEYVAGLALAEKSGYSPDTCRIDILQHADNCFEFPIRQHQFWHCARHNSSPASLMEPYVDSLLKQHHPGPLSTALRLHLMDRSGYVSGREYLLEKARDGNADVLKRVCQLIHHLPCSRADEVKALIMAAKPYQGWSVLQWTSNLLIWLCPVDWPTCKLLIQEHNFFGNLNRLASAYGIVAQIGTQVLQYGLTADPSFVLRNAIRLLHTGRQAGVTLIFLIRCAAADSVKRNHAWWLVKQLLKWARSCSVSQLGPVVDLAARCLGLLWSRFPALCQLECDHVVLTKATDLHLSLRALALLEDEALLSIRNRLLIRLNHNLGAAALQVLLQRMVIPQLQNARLVPALRLQVIAQCTQLVAGLSDQSYAWEASIKSIVVDFVRVLQEKGSCPAVLDDFLGFIPARQWLDDLSLLRLLPMALVNGLPSAKESMVTLLGNTAQYPSHISVLRAALPNLICTSSHLDMALSLAVAGQSSTLAISALKKAIANDGWSTLRPAAERHAPRLLQLALIMSQDTKSQSRALAYALLDVLILQKLVDRLPPLQALSWAERETTLRTSAQVSVQNLLVTCITVEHSEQTIQMLLNAAINQPGNVRHHSIFQLRQALMLKGLNLSQPLLAALIDFALQSDAKLPQVRLLGRVMDIRLSVGDTAGANLTALKLLYSPTLMQLSAVQKRQICHHLDKSFQQLYFRLGTPELRLHLEALSQLDALAGRLVVVALCKTTRSDRDEWARELTANECVHWSLRKTVNDYQQYRWGSPGIP